MADRSGVPCWRVAVGGTFVPSYFLPDACLCTVDVGLTATATVLRTFVEPRRAEHSPPATHQPPLFSRPDAPIPQALPFSPKPRANSPFFQSLVRIQSLSNKETRTESSWFSISFSCRAQTTALRLDGQAGSRARSWSRPKKPDRGQAALPRVIRTSADPPSLGFRFQVESTFDLPCPVLLSPATRLFSLPSFCLVASFFDCLAFVAPLRPGTVHWRITWAERRRQTHALPRNRNEKPVLGT
jgi:hypothetical protein